MVHISWVYVQLLKSVCGCSKINEMKFCLARIQILKTYHSINESPGQVVCLEYWIGKCHLKQLCALKRSQAHFVPRAWEAWDQESGIWPKFSTELLCSSNLISLCLSFPSCTKITNNLPHRDVVRPKLFFVKGRG